MSSEWAERIAGGARLGDRRRNASLELILLALLYHRQLSWSAALGPRLRQAGGDLIGLVISLTELLFGAYQETARRSAEQEWVIVTFDKSAFNFSGLKSLFDQLGNLGTQTKARGVWAMSGLVLTPLGEPLGVIHVKVWARPDGLAPAAERPYQERESYAWEEGVAAAIARLQPGQQLLAVADREADIFEFLNMPLPAGADLLVRCGQARKYCEEGCDDPATASVLKGIWSRPVASRVTRPCGSRTAFLSVYHLRAQLCSPTKWPAARRCRLWVTVIGVREEHPPKGVKPLEWVLVTTRALHTADEALEMVQVYSRRWRIETLHETIKREGLRIERLQMRSLGPLKLAIGLHYVVGCRAMELCFQARENPALPAVERFDDEELAVLTTLRGSPVLTLGEAVALVAKLGGWEGYASSPPYGPRSVQRGLEALANMITYRRAAEGKSYDPR
jgi:hypothetical protein